MISLIFVAHFSFLKTGKNPKSVIKTKEYFQFTSISSLETFSMLVRISFPLPTILTLVYIWKAHTSSSTTRLIRHLVEAIVQRKIIGKYWLVYSVVKWDHCCFCHMVSQQIWSIYCYWNQTLSNTSYGFNSSC